MYYNEVKEQVELLPEYVKSKIDKLEKVQQQEFANKFKRKRRSIVMGIILSFFGLQYLYIDITSFKNWILQALYYATGALFGLWLIFDCIRMKSIISKFYEKEANKIISIL